MINKVLTNQVKSKHLLSYIYTAIQGNLKLNILIKDIENIAVNPNTPNISKRPEFIWTKFFQLWKLCLLNVGQRTSKIQ